MPLTDYLTLFDVLVVPEYSASLMYVHKVARDSKLIIDFDEANCYLLNKDLRAGKIFKTCRQFGGLYYFDGNQGKITVVILVRDRCPRGKEGIRSIISMVSISLEGFMPSILLLVMIIVAVVIVAVILVVVVIDAIVGVVIVVASIGVVVVVMIIGIVVIVDGGVSHIIKLSFGIIGFLHRFML
nr:ribonuclease H-like domain-containing protein [Tanacetum cinerariifolium]